MKNIKTLFIGLLVGFVLVLIAHNINQDRKIDWLQEQITDLQRNEQWTFRQIMKTANPEFYEATK